MGRVGLEQKSMKPSKFGQNASKWKRLLLGGLSCRPSKRGQWSESLEAQLCNRQSGNNSSHSIEQKTLSSFTSVGEALVEELDQVYLRP